MITEFLSCLLGTWSNKQQAYGNPSKFAWILISWEQVDDGKFYTKQWYHYKGENDPYREKYYTMTETESGILLQNWNLDWTRNERCDTIITPDIKGKWFGTNIGTDCIVRGAVLRSEFQLSNNSLMTRDAGYLDDQLIWGSKDYYHFGRLTQR
jgi:hypothetical protein